MGVRGTHCDLNDDRDGIRRIAEDLTGSLRSVLIHSGEAQGRVQLSSLVSSHRGVDLRPMPQF